MRGLFSSSSKSTGGGAGRSGFDDDEEEDEEEEDGSTGSEESDDGVGRVLEATTSRERRPLEVDDEDDEWGDFEVGSGANAQGQVLGENSSDEEPAAEIGVSATQQHSLDDQNGTQREKDEDEEDGDALVEIAMPKKDST